MTFLAPWALVLGAAGAAGALLLHLVSRQRPAAYLLPTARFIPDRQTLVSRVATRPTDLLLLALRMLLLLAAGAAFARPVLTGHHAPLGRIVLLDRSGAVADTGEAWRRARGLVGDGTPGVLIAFDSAAVVCPCPEGAERPKDLLSADRGAGPSVRSGRQGSVTAALLAARRAAPAVATRADSVELVLVSPLAAEELDDATAAARALWPGGVRIERVALRGDSSARPTLEQRLSLSDPLGPAVAGWPVLATAHATRLRRAAALDARDSVFALAGGTVVLWDSTAKALAATGVARGNDVVVATLGRGAVGDSGAIVARWADGAAAARERTLGAGCVRTVGIALPASGDLPLRPAFHRLVRGLLAPCAAQAPLHPADSSAITRLTAGTPFVAAEALRGQAATTSPIVPWLLGLALLCALAELALRGRASREEPA